MMTRKVLLSIFVLTFISRSVFGQTYCTPTVTGNGTYFNYIEFGYGGQTGSSWSTANGGYTFQSTSSATRTSYFSYSIWLGCQNTNASSRTVYVDVFADWNNDGDFLDANEHVITTQKTLGASSSTGWNTAFSIPVDALPGNCRMRFIVNTSAVTNPCNAVTGEVEDYILTVATNQAPVLAASPTPLANSELTSQTTGGGFTIDQLADMFGSSPLSDGNDAGSSKTARGIAITDYTATNGSWQYKVSNGSWTNFPSVSNTNALLLTNDGATQALAKLGTRIRFVPTGTGSPSITFRGWDCTTGSNATTASTTSNGGTTAFSTAAATVTMPIVSAAGTGAWKFYASGLVAPTRTSKFDFTNNTIFEPDSLSTATGNQLSVDMKLDNSGNYLYYTDYDNVFRSAPDGSGETVIASNLSFSSTSIALSTTHLYYINYGSTYELWRVPLGGGSAQALVNGTNQLSVTSSNDYFLGLDYYSNKLYCWHYDDNAASQKFEYTSMDADGTNPTTLFSSGATSIISSTISNGDVYWIEQTGSNYYIKTRPVSGSGTTQTIVTTTTPLSAILADKSNGILLVAATPSSSTYSSMYEVTISNGTMTRVGTIDGTVSSLAAVIPGNVSLPLHLLSWDAAQKNTSALLSWELTNEEPGTSYVLERSEDGFHFQPLATIPGKKLTHYSWVDQQPLRGDNYYRLSAVEQGQQPVYYGIRKLHWNASSGMTVYPSPFSEEGFTITQSGNLQGTETYYLLDESSRIVRKGALESGHTNVNGGGLPSGHYLLKTGSLTMPLIRQ